VFAGALDRDRVEGSDLNRLERAITRRFIPEGDWRDWDAIDRWADEIASSLLGSAAAQGALCRVRARRGSDRAGSSASIRPCDEHRTRRVTDNVL
jgi:hypothetical protein